MPSSHPWQLTASQADAGAVRHRAAHVVVADPALACATGTMLGERLDATLAIVLLTCEARPRQPARDACAMLSTASGTCPIFQNRTQRPTASATATATAAP